MPLGAFLPDEVYCFGFFRYFTHSVIQAKQASDIVYPYSNNALYKADGMNFRSVNLFISEINGIEYPLVATAITDGHLTAEQIFSGLLDARESRWEGYNNIS